MNVSGSLQQLTITALKGSLGASHNSQGHPSSFGQDVNLCHEAAFPLLQNSESVCNSSEWDVWYEIQVAWLYQVSSIFIYSQNLDSHQSLMHFAAYSV